MPSPTLVWFRQDLRLTDQPALAAAAQAGPMLGVYILDEDAPGPWRTGAAARWWLHHSLAALSTAFSALGGKLLLLRGDTVSLLPRLAAEVGARTVHANAHQEPWARQQEARLARTLSLELAHGNSLHPIGAIRTGAGEGYKVFSPFWRALSSVPVPDDPIPAPDRLIPPAHIPTGESLDDWHLRPTRPNWAKGWETLWTPGEAGANHALAHFSDAALADYADQRDACATPGTSRLSPHLHFGEISPRQAFRAALAQGGQGEAFRRQLGWREFMLSLLHHAPDMAEKNWRPAFNAFPWATDAAALRAWQRGQTGYPLVDAGMRELWHTGWMHNRVRMVVASFLVKHLRIDWRHGQAWFWDTLLDADLANNAGGWQWVAGSGADAAPYFRIFNPVTQGTRFDGAGDYVRRWVPELAPLPDRFLHSPWTAPPALLQRADIILGETYPHPLVDHALARVQALAAYERVKFDA